MVLYCSFNDLTKENNTYDINNNIIEVALLCNPLTRTSILKEIYQ